MSLLEEARELAQERAKRPPCVIAKAIMGSDLDVQEVAELLQDSVVDSVVKFDILSGAGIRMARSTFQVKVLQGCQCSWCAEYGVSA